ncbi:MAG TPA: HlyD family secretion protein [Polyangia bacterium]|nr:HlyD family secretion protein [Polyangia bacterium]
MDPAPEPERRGNGHDRAPAARPPFGARVRRAARDHRRGVRIGAIVLAVLVVGSLLAWWYFSGFESTDDAQIDAHISTVSTRVAGTVTAVYVEDNQEVKAGQLLVQLDPRDFRVAAARAKAELAQAQAQLEAEHPNVPITETANVTQLATSEQDVSTARSALAAAERDREAAVARVRQAEANLARADADERRYQFLLDERAVTRERYDQIIAAAKAARAEVDSQRALARAAAKNADEQRARIEQALARQSEVRADAPRQLVIRRAALNAREAAIEAAQSSLERAQLDVEYATISAPIAGTTGRRSVEPGNRVQPGEQLLAIVDLDDVWVTANFKETQLRKIRVGQRARVHVDALAQDFDGWVESFAAASGARYSLLPPENATGNYVKVVQRIPVRIRLKPGQDPKHRLRPGLSVEPKVFVR